MNFSAVVDSICVERIELMKQLAENRQRMLVTLSYPANTSLSILQNVQSPCEEYLRVQEEITILLIDLDALEQEVLSRMSEM